MKRLLLLLTIPFFVGACGSSPKHAKTGHDGKKVNHSKHGSQTYIPAYGEETSLEDIIYESLGHKRGSGVRYSAYLEQNGKFDIPYTYNSYVQKWIDYFTGQGRDHFARYLTRSGRFIPYIHAVLKDYGLPKDIVYLSMIESGFNIRAKSWASAVGPWQFIRSTGALYGLNVDYYVDERRDVEKATQAAAHHLKDLYDEFGDWYLAFAAYNAGAGKIRNAIARDGSNFWNMVEGRYLRQETKDYVPKILAAATIAKNPVKYGFTNIEYQIPIDYERIKVKSPIDLEVAAECSGVDADLIRLLNPELLQDMTPPYIPGYSLNIPRGTKNRFMRKYASLSPSQLLQAKEYVVQKGDSVADIASMYGVSQQDLYESNSGKIDVEKHKASRSVKVRGRHGRVKLKKEKYTIASYRVSPGTSLTIPKNRSLSGYASSRDDEAAHAAKAEFGLRVASAEEAPRKLSKKEQKALEKQAKAERLAQLKLEKEQKKTGKVSTPSLASLPSQGEGTVGKLTKSDDLAIEGDAVASPEIAAAEQASPKSDLEKVNPSAVEQKLPSSADTKSPSLSPLAFNNRPDDAVETAGVPTTPSDEDLKAAVKKIQPATDDLSTPEEAPKKKWVEQTVTDLGSETPVSPSEAQPKLKSTKSSFYVVKRGDTLAEIAQRYGVSVADLKQWNGKKVAPVLKRGVKIQVGGGNSVAIKKSSKKSSEVVRYKVKPGDNLTKIAKIHATTPQEIQKLNGMKSPKVLPGAILIVQRK